MPPDEPANRSNDPQSGELKPWEVGSLGRSEVPAASQNEDFPEGHHSHDRISLHILVENARAIALSGGLWPFSFLFSPLQAATWQFSSKSRGFLAATHSERYPPWSGQDARPLYFGNAAGTRPVSIWSGTCSFRPR